jgi:hypothetical protein
LLFFFEVAGLMQGTVLLPDCHHLPGILDGVLNSEADDLNFHHREHLKSHSQPVAS